MADKPNITINITGANPQIYPSAEHITHNHYYGDQFAEAAIKANKKEILLNQQEEEKEESTDNPLKRFIPNKEDLDYVVEYAKVCKTPRDINNCIVNPLKKRGYGLEVTTNAPFLKALIPYLENYKSSKNADSISRALR